jgi:hypothetical protein
MKRAHIDADRIHDAVLALSLLGLHDEYGRVWKSFDFVAIFALVERVPAVREIPIRRCRHLARRSARNTSARLAARARDGVAFQRMAAM